MKPDTTAKRKSVRFTEGLARIAEHQRRGLSWMEISAAMYDDGYEYVGHRSLCGIVSKARRTAATPRKDSDGQ